jgi:hypothetical protein
MQRERIRNLSPIAALVMMVAWSGCDSDADQNPNDVQGAGADGSAAGAGGLAGVGGLAGSGAGGVGEAGTGVAGIGAGGVGEAGTGEAGSGEAGSGEAGSGDAGAAGVGLAGAGGSGDAGAGGAPPVSGVGCTPPPSGTFQTTTEMGGPGGTYTIVRPTTLGENGFLHPPVAWGNGLGTTPALYTAFLQNLASQGFVVIANPGTGSNPMVVRQGLEWLIAQNSSGQYAGKLASNCAATIGYSMGGGAAVGSGSHPEVRAIVSMFGLQDAAERASGPILLTTSEGDTFVTKSGFVEPCYRRSTVQPTILASYRTGSHLDPIGDGGISAEPAIAWLRYWLYGDQTQRDWFFGDNCRLCSWADFRRKNHPEWD